MDATAPELTVTGSSPRGRGKLYKVCVPCIARRLIPAWAGKTRCPSRARRLRAAHPRVGGENTRGAGRRSSFAGSSPRGRGKREGDAAGCGLVGLIPAWAGKTVGEALQGRDDTAHPRVGGENRKPALKAQRTVGSSPRGRGKQAGSRPARPRGRLIPAWAGKTRAPGLAATAHRAHPRVGGENVLSRALPRPVRGSSPRGRGKPRLRRGVREALGLIPAWAGKTSRAWAGPPPSAAHPRVGGENMLGAAVIVDWDGSSPRGRGKPFNKT